MPDPTPISKTQVVIVGAGPTGLSMAVQLMRYNIDFIILEKNEKTTHLSKAIAVQARTLEIFQELGLAEPAIREGQVTTGINLFYKGKRMTWLDLSGLGQGLSPFPFALSLEQSKTEKLLAACLAVAGKRIEWNTDFERFEQNEKGVIVHYRNAAGQEQKTEAAYLVGCDGASSPVRHQMDLHFEGDTVPKIFYVADVKLKSDVINKNQLFAFLIRKGFILFFPMEGEGHYRVIGILPEVEDPNQAFEFTDIEDSIKKEVVSPLLFEELHWFSSYRVHSRKANAFEKDRCFIAGDAAHIHTPAGGQGMNTGIQDAYNLAWKMALVLRGETRPNLLTTYNTEREENATRLLKTTDRLFDLFAGSNRFLNAVRLTLFPLLARFVTRSSWVRKRVFPLISQTGIAYPNSALTVKSSVGNVKAGDRMPYFVFKNGKQIFEYLADPAFKLLFFGKEDRRNMVLSNGFQLKIISHHFNEVPASLFGAQSDFYVLLRPDNHISYIGKDHTQCTGFLRSLAANP